MSDDLSKEEVLEKQIHASCQVLRDAEIFEAIFTIMRCGVDAETLIDKFGSFVTTTSPKLSVENKTRQKRCVQWSHYAYLVNMQTVQISCFSENLDSNDDSGMERLNIYLFYNNQLVLSFPEAAERETYDTPSNPWEFATLNFQNLRLVKLQDDWVRAIKDLASEFVRLNAEQGDRLRVESATNWLVRQRKLP